MMTDKELEQANAEIIPLQKQLAEAFKKHGFKFYIGGIKIDGVRDFYSTAINIKVNELALLLAGTLEKEYKDLAMLILATCTEEKLKALEGDEENET